MKWSLTHCLLFYYITYSPHVYRNTFLCMHTQLWYIIIIIIR